MPRTKPIHREYLKRDDQLLAFRVPEEERRRLMVADAQDRDRAYSQPDHVIENQRNGELQSNEDVSMLDPPNRWGLDYSGAKVIVIHPGSQNLRIGLASDALAKTVPMVIARKWESNESENLEPKPKRFKADDGADLEPEKMFGQEVSVGISCHEHSLISIVCEPIQYYVYESQASHASQQTPRSTKFQRACR